MLMILDRFELGLGWFGEFDGYDIGALGLLARGPSVCSSSIPFTWRPC